MLLTYGLYLLCHAIDGVASFRNHNITNNERMTRVIVVFILLLQSFWGLSQALEPIDKYNIDKGCYKGGQQDVNICLVKAEQRLSSIMQMKYGCLITYFDIKIKMYSVKKDTLTVSEYSKMKKHIIASQATWKKMTTENASFYGVGGGTITPMLVAQSLLADLKSRLKWLDNVIEELGQGNEAEVLKCK